MRPDPVASTTPSISARIVGPRDFENLTDAWDRLATNALEENALYSRAYVMAGLAHIDRPERIRALCLHRRGADGTEHLVGLLPFTRSRFRYGIPAPVDLGAQNVFQPNGTPLVDRDHAEEAVAALLTALHDGTGIGPNLLLPNVRRTGPFARLVLETASRAGIDAGFTGARARPVLRRRQEDAESYFARSVAPKRLRELRRTHRRLGELGSLGYRHTSAADEVAAAIEGFLRIEKTGWKGEAGTAFLSDPKAAAFARAAFAGQCAGQPIASADVLSLDGAAVAVSLNLQVGRTSFAVKCAYDESFRRYGPGLVLEYLVIEHLFESRFADELDSCVTENGHVIQNLWDGTEEVGTLVLRPHAARVGLGPFRIDLARAETLRGDLRSRAKEVRHAARERLPEQARALRSRIGANSRHAMMSLNAAQPNGELAAVIAAVI